MEKPSLTKGNRPDLQLMVRLGPESPHRNKHPFILQKRANTTLPHNVVVGRVAHINSGLALIPAPGTSLVQLEEHRAILFAFLALVAPKETRNGQNIWYVGYRVKSGHLTA